MSNNNTPSWPLRYRYGAPTPEQMQLLYNIAVVALNIGLLTFCFWLMGAWDFA